MAYRWTLGLLAAFALGCFTDTEETSTPCPDGASGCSCYGNGTCDDNLICNADSNCVSQDCEDGRVECPCYGNGTCDGDLVCTDNICQPMAGTGSDSATSSATSTTSNTSVGPTTNASMTSVGVSGFLESSGTFGVTTFPGETGIPPICDCVDGQACYPGDKCGPTPYVPCEPGGICDGGECLAGPSAESVCAPSCMSEFECPILQGPFAFPACIMGNCVLPCSRAEECPPGLDACSDGALGFLHCAASGIAPK